MDDTNNICDLLAVLTPEPTPEKGHIWPEKKERRGRPYSFTLAARRRKVGKAYDDLLRRRESRRVGVNKLDCAIRIGDEFGMHPDRVRAAHKEFVQHEACNEKYKDIFPDDDALSANIDPEYSDPDYYSA